jgi:multiple sugar transport system permease protein
MTAVAAEQERREEVPAVRPARRPVSLQRRLNRALLYVVAIAITLFMLLPIYLIAISAFSSRNAVFRFPKSLIPTAFSTDTLRFFLNSTGVLPAARNSIVVGLLTLVFSLLIGAPAGLALARYGFRGRDAFQVLILSTRAFPIVILSIPLTVTFINWGLYDTVFAVALAHTALALPTTILVTSSIFVSVPRDLEEAAQTLGCTPFGAFRRVVLPLSLPGIAAAAIFTFVLSWNEVFAATILTLRNRTLPAHVLGALNDSPLYFRFAGGFALVVPSLVFIFFMRRYLFNMWGRVVR